MVSELLKHRKAGVLLHPTSLPGPYQWGILDNNAYRFVDFLAHCHFKVWQLLPLSPVSEDRSPYNSASAFAGNPELISIHKLYSDFFQHHNIGEPADLINKKEKLRVAFIDFKSLQNPEIKNQYREFLERESHWLDNFALFMVIRKSQHNLHWNQWPEALRAMEPNACDIVKANHADEYDLIRFEQFVFYHQWSALRNYANSKGIEIIGDLPIFVSDNSADVWSMQREFKLTPEGTATVVAGVPPDYFSATGQRWGNPVYDWEAMEATGFSWWVKRMARALELFDIVRVDHFRGFAATWEIPAHEETAINGEWVATPGEKLLTVFNEVFGDLPIIAEDLGIITDDVEALRDNFGLPGMKILQFAFDSDAHNPYLPHNHVENCVIYTGTHDNDTTVGWYNSSNPNTKDRMNRYLGWPSEQMPWPIIKCALASVAKLAVLPMQDVMLLGSEHRMNTPGTTTDNWRWRFQWHQISDDLSQYLTQLNELYLRC